MAEDQALDTPPAHVAYIGVAARLDVVEPDTVDEAQYELLQELQQRIAEIVADPHFEPIQPAVI